MGKYVDYTIRFQNTGNDTAFTVVIADTLSSNLQANTLQMVASSHSCKTTVTGNTVLFEFNNINLADSIVNEKASHRFVSFKIKPKATLVNGNTISNKAYIYFDYNAPIITNNAITQINISGVLTPVKLSSYDVSCNNCGTTNYPEKRIINLWSTTTETNVLHFHIQRSTNAKEFKSIGTVAAKGLANDYQFTDPLKNLEFGIKNLYYRLQIIDKDGSYSYSSIKQIQINQSANRSINIYPNPAKDLVTIDCTNAKEILIIDNLGRNVKQFNNITQLIIFNTKNLTKGLYLVKIITDNGITKTEKLLVE